MTADMESVGCESKHRKKTPLVQIVDRKQGLNWKNVHQVLSMYFLYNKYLSMENHGFIQRNY